MFFKKINSECHKPLKDDAIKVKHICNVPELGDLGVCEKNVLKTVEYQSYGVSHASYAVEQLKLAKAYAEKELANIEAIQLKILEDKKSILDVLCSNSQSCKTK